MDDATIVNGMWRVKRNWKLSKLFDKADLVAQILKKSRRRRLLWQRHVIGMVSGQSGTETI